MFLITDNACIPAVAAELEDCPSPSRMKPMFLSLSLPGDSMRATWPSQRWVSLGGPIESGGAGRRVSQNIPSRYSPSVGL